MQRYFKIPLLFLFAGTVLGILLRMQMVYPLPFNYSNFLHGHSHVMFLGWVFNFLYIGFTSNHIPQEQRKGFIKLFFALQVLTSGMLISFPMQGYGFISILLSTLHTLLGFVYTYYFFRLTRGQSSASLWFSKLALLFLVLSSIGPFSLGFLMANGLSRTYWYNYAIYFYLHFQYNGFFIFGVLSLFIHLFEKESAENSMRIRRFGTWLAISTVPAYLLSILYSSPGVLYNIIGGAAVIFQLLLVFYFFWLLRTSQILVMASTAVRKYNWLVYVVVFAFIMKILLQIISAVPVIAKMAYEMRPVLIAYLHLVLVGVITLSLFLWLLLTGFLTKSAIVFIKLFVVTFIMMEAVLVLSPWWNVFPDHTPSSSLFLLATAIVLSLCVLAILLSRRQGKS